MGLLNKTRVMREAEIHPDALLEGQRKAFASDIAWLARQEESFVEVLCPACNSDNWVKRFDKYGQTFVLCLDCETVYMNPRPRPETLSAYYKRSENYRYWNEHIFPASEKARRSKIFRPRAKRIERLYEQKSGGILLEIGAGFGTFCEEINRLGVFNRVIALEPVPELAQTCRSKGLEVVEKTIEDFGSIGEEVDAIVGFELIEHLFSPYECLVKCADLLSDNGLLALTCPNIKGFDIALLQSLSDAVDVEHLNYFNPESLVYLVRRCGFEVLEIETPGKLDVEIVRKQIELGKLTLPPFFEDMLWDKGDAFQRFLAENKLSSHMWLVASKKGNGW